MRPLRSLSTATGYWRSNTEPKIFSTVEREDHEQLAHSNSREHHVPLLSLRQFEQGASKARQANEFEIVVSQNLIVLEFAVASPQGLEGFVFDAIALAARIIGMTLGLIVEKTMMRNEALRSLHDNFENVAANGLGQTFGLDPGMKGNMHITG